MKPGHYIVQVWNGKTWRKRRDIDPIPEWSRMWKIGDDGIEREVRVVNGLSRARRLATSCENAQRAESSSDGRPHRVVYRKAQP